MNVCSSFVSPVRKDITLLRDTATVGGKDKPFASLRSDCMCYNLINSLMAGLMCHRRFCWYTHTAKAELEKIHRPKIWGDSVL